jgi:phage terminase small subunit
MKDETLASSVSQSASKWRKFVDAYMANGFNKGQAAIEAGYAKDDAHSVSNYLLTKPEVQRLIRKKQAQAGEKYALTQDILIEQYEDAYLIAKEERNIAGMIAATDSMGKMAGLISTVQKTENKNTTEAVVTIKRPELEDRIKRLKGEVDAFLQ